MAQKIAILQVDTEAKHLRSIQSPISTCIRQTSTRISIWLMPCNG